MLLGLGAIAAVAVFAFAVYIRRHDATVYRTIRSPNGRYAIVVYRYPQFVPAGPGQGGDADGFVQLQDRTGHVLREQAVEMVQNIDQVTWQPDTVHVKLFADWSLP